MSAICQTFVQNAWRKDLCSNCFKSKDEHGGPGKAGVHRQPSKGPGDLSDGKRYMGVAASAYQRSYYGQNSWKSIMIDSNDSGLKSPGLIKGVNLVTHENEKNLKLNNLKAEVGGESKVEAPSLRGSSLLQNVKSTPSEAKLLSELLGDNGEKPKDKADVSSDLGSDASNDSTSSSSSEGANSGSDGLGAHSDTASVRSDAGSEAAADKGSGVPSTPLQAQPPPPPQGILKDFSLVKSRRGPITFGPVDEIIGYGGDVDYSDDDDDYLDDDDDDDDSVASLELTIEERIVRRITQRNTDFNGENENLDEDTLVPEDAKLAALLKQAERLRKEEEDEDRDAIDMEDEDADEELDYDEEEEEVEGTTPQKGPSPTAAPRLSKQKVEDKPEGRVKLKRSPPLVSVKPFITRSSSSDARVNQVLPMKNGEVVRPGQLSSEEVLGVDAEDVPLKGIKPKYVALEDEMKEKSYSDEEKDTGRGKVTAIDDVCPPRLQRLERIEEKVTRLDDVVPIRKETVTRLDDPAPLQKEVVTKKDALTPAQKEVVPKTKDPVPLRKEVVERSDEVVHAKKVVVTRTDDDVVNKAVTKKDNEVPGDKRGTEKSGKEVATEKEVVDKQESAVLKKSDTSILDKVAPSGQGATRLETKIPSEKKVVPKLDNAIKDIHGAVTPLNNVINNVQGSTNEAKVAENLKVPEVQARPLPKERNQSASEGSVSVGNRGDVRQRDEPKREAAGVVPSAVAPDLPKDPPPATLPSIQPKQDFSRKESTTSISSSSTSEDTRSSSETATRSGTSHSSAEACKTPASRQSSSSSGLSTFGTPVVLNSQSPQNSFLHSSRSMRYEDPYHSPNAIYAPATNFLKDIKSQPEVVTQTAGIQKSALYASTSCLKGLPGAKPVITPKPPILKDKPKVPLKPGLSTSRIYATPSPVVPKVPMGSLSGALSTPNLALPPPTIERQVSSDSASASSEVSHKSDLDEPSSSSLRTTTTTMTTTKSSGRELGLKHSEPPTMPAPPTPTMTSTPARQPRDIPEVVYEVPSPIVAATRVDCRASVISVSCPDKDLDEASIYSEVSSSQGEGGRLQEAPLTTPQGSGGDLDSESPSFTRQESTRAQARSTFEANRSFLSSSLDFGTRATRSSSSKRQAPKPPREEGVEEEATAAEEEAEATQTSDSSPPPKDQPASSEVTEVTEVPEPRESPNSLAPPLPDNKDGESYSSFTDDFDDEEDDDYEDEQRDPQFQPLRRTERSSSATPMYRNSIGPSITYDPSGYNGNHQVHPDPSLAAFAFQRPGQSGSASRSQSVPRSTDHIIIPPPAAASGGPTPASSSSSSSRFGFGRSGFFRPSSPPTNKRDSSDRGRDRTKKSSSKFSLKKLLGFGAKDDDKKGAKDQVEKKGAKAEQFDKKAAEREAKKSKLQIIHPLDYNQNGVEVIARPQKTCPLYDYSGLYGYIPPPKQIPSPQLQKKSQQVSGDNNVVLTKATPLSTSVEPIYAPSPVQQAPTTMPAPSPVPSLSSKRSERSEDSYGQVSGYSSSPQHSLSNSQAPLHAGQDKRTSIVRKESLAEARPGSAQHLGFNSEGRPKPPPPPRKASLEAQQSGLEGYAELAPPSTPTSRPQRPPPPHHGAPPRTPSSSSSSGSALTRAGPPRPEPPRLGKDSVYANLGDVRAPITPRKPGRSASLRGDDDREKRRAPQPPYTQGCEQSTGPAGARNGKGPAPSRPQSHYQTVSSGYGISTHNTAPDASSTSSSSSLASASSSRPDKTSRLSVRRGSALLHRTLEDQYGAVVSANLHALSNLLEQLSQRRVPSGYEEIEREVSRWSDLELGDSWMTEGVAGRRYYPGTACGSDVTIMITPEVKLEAHYLLTALPIASFKDHVPSGLVSARGGHVLPSVPATVWVLPRLRISPLREYADLRRAHNSLATVNWQQEVCLLVLQLVTALKHLQAQSVEEISIDLVLVAYGGLDADPRMLVLPPSPGAEQASTGVMSLCRCAVAALYVLLGVEGAVEKAQTDCATALPTNFEMHSQLSALVNVLRQERAGSLSKVKCALEFLLWGPEDLSSQETESEDQEATLQRWLDLERATVLHSLIKKVPEPQVAVTYNLLFLVRSNARVLREAAALLQEPEVTMF